MGKLLKRALRRIVGAPAQTWRTTLHLARALRHDPACRDRLLAQAVFAGIFAFAVGALDFILTGGPDWNPDGVAYAYEAPRRVAASAVAFVPAEAPPPFLQAEETEPEFAALGVEDLLGGPELELASLNALDEAELSRAIDALHRQMSLKPTPLTYSGAEAVTEKTVVSERL